MGVGDGEAAGEGEDESEGEVIAIESGLLTGISSSASPCRRLRLALWADLAQKAEANLKSGEIKWTLFAAGSTPDFFTGTGVVINID